MPPEPVIDHLADILGRRDQPLAISVRLTELGDLQVEVLVIHVELHLRPDQVTQVLHIDKHTGHGIHLATHPYIQLVVVSVIMGIGAKPEHLPVALIRPIGVSQSVGGIEVGFSNYGSAHRGHDLTR